MEFGISFGIFIMNSKITQLNTLYYHWSSFAVISHGLADTNDFREILNFDRPTS